MIPTEKPIEKPNNSKLFSLGDMLKKALNKFNIFKDPIPTSSTKTLKKKSKLVIKKKSGSTKK